MQRESHEAKAAVHLTAFSYDHINLCVHILKLCGYYAYRAEKAPYRPLNLFFIRALNPLRMYAKACK